jgi:hypothetical protein
VGTIIQFDGIRRRVVFQGTSPANVSKQTRSSEFHGNQYVQMQLPFAILGSQNWRQVARKLGGPRVAFETLQREFETRPLPPLAGLRRAA